MTESRLRTLVALAATGSVRGAASRLTVTESAVSASIGALARELGVPLVEPVGRGLRLTASGMRDTPVECWDCSTRVRRLRCKNSTRNGAGFGSPR
jgi:hypothetical protein